MATTHESARSRVLGGQISAALEVEKETSLWHQTVSGWFSAQQAMMGAAAEITREHLGFTQNQMTAGMEAWRKVAACPDPKLALACQNEEMQKMAAAYLAHVKKIGDRVTHFAASRVSETADAAESVGKKMQS